MNSSRFNLKQAAYLAVLALGLGTSLAGCIGGGISPALTLEERNEKFGLNITQGQNQWVAPDTPVHIQPAVRFTDVDGKPIENALTHWYVLQNFGSLEGKSQRVIRTDSNGFAALDVDWVPGSEDGTNAKLRVQSGSFSVEFTALITTSAPKLAFEEAPRSVMFSKRNMDAFTVQAMTADGALDTSFNGEVSVWKKESGSKTLLSQGTATEGKITFTEVHHKGVHPGFDFVISAQGYSDIKIENMKVYPHAVKKARDFLITAREPGGGTYEIVTADSYYDDNPSDFNYGTTFNVTATSSGSTLQFFSKYYKTVDADPAVLTAAKEIADKWIERQIPVTAGNESSGGVLADTGQSKIYSTQGAIFMGIGWLDLYEVTKEEKYKTAAENAAVFICQMQNLHDNSRQNAPDDLVASYERWGGLGRYRTTADNTNPNIYANFMHKVDAYAVELLHRLYGYNKSKVCVTQFDSYNYDEMAEDLAAFSMQSVEKHHEFFYPDNPYHQGSTPFTKNAWHYHYAGVDLIGAWVLPFDPNSGNPTGCKAGQQPASCGELHFADSSLYLLIGISEAYGWNYNIGGKTLHQVYDELVGIPKDPVGPNINPQDSNFAPNYHSWIYDPRISFSGYFLGPADTQTAPFKAAHPGVGLTTVYMAPYYDMVTVGLNLRIAKSIGYNDNVRYTAEKWMRHFDESKMLWAYNFDFAYVRAFNSSVNPEWVNSTVMAKIGAGLVDTFDIYAEPLYQQKQQQLQVKQSQ